LPSFTLHTIALAAVAISTLSPARADQKALQSDATLRSDLNYLLYTPEGYEASREAYPLVVWLHGGGQGGGDIARVKTTGLPRLIEEGRDFPFLVFSPQNPSEDLLFPIERVKAALDQVVAEHRVDARRIYVLGYSRGGFGAWSMAEQFPQTFAAVVPIAGGGVRHYLNRTNEDAAFWVFHGAKDESIPLGDSVVMVQRLTDLERDVRLTVFEGVDHAGSEPAALAEPGLWDWLLEQRLPEPPAAAAP
jgi:predicted peptidase